jgi:hypothetical protein
MSLSMTSATGLMPPAASLALNSALYTSQPAQQPTPAAAQLSTPASPRNGNLQTQGSGMSEAEMLTALMGEINKLKSELGEH